MSRIALVTGATQGLGFALVEGLAQRLTPEDVIYLTGRDAQRVEDASRRLQAPVANVHPAVLDVRDTPAMDSWAAQLRDRHGGIDIIFSNAAERLAPGIPSAQLVTPFVDTNNLGTTRLLRAFSPLLRPRGRLIVVASSFGTL